MSANNWIPDPAVIERDLELITSLGALRRDGYLADHREKGFLWNVWITSQTRQNCLKQGYLGWLEKHQSIESFDFWGDDVLVSFKTADDAMLFKLTFFGM